MLHFIGAAPEQSSAQKARRRGRERTGGIAFAIGASPVIKERNTKEVDPVMPLDAGARRKTFRRDDALDLPSRPGESAF
jgi:hypothetical protein